MGEFDEVARMRSREAGVLEKAQHQLGAVYLTGYVVECYVKHLLQQQGTPFPRGREGHNLRGLWEATGFPEPSGHAQLFFQHWDTALRYVTELPEGVDADDLLRGGRDLARWVTQRTRQNASRRRRVSR